MGAEPERSWLSVEWDKPRRPSAVHGFLDQVAGRLIGDKTLRRSGEREWRKAAEQRDKKKSGSRSRGRARPSAPNGRSNDGNVFSGISGIFGGRKLIGVATPPAPPPRRGTTSRDRQSRSAGSSGSRPRRQDSQGEPRAAPRRRTTDSSTRTHRQERR